LPAISSTIQSARLLADGSNIGFTQTKDGVVLTLPEATSGETDRVVVLTR